jgi:hypothetical protein
MHRHAHIVHLINSLSAKERSDFLKREDALPVENKLITFLSQHPAFNKTKAAEKLKLSEKKYKKCCEATYTQLWNFLLSKEKSLADDIQHNIREAQLMAELMKERGLIDEAENIIEATIETAMKHELFSQEISLRHQYLKITFYQQKTPASDKALFFAQRIGSVIALQKDIEKLHLIYHHLVTLRYKMAFRTSPEEQEEVKNLWNNLQVFVPATLQSNTARIYYYHSCLLTAYMLGWMENISWWNNCLLQNWQKQSHLIPLHPELFIRSASLQAYTHFLLKDINAAKTFLEQYHDLSTQYLSSAFYKKWFDIVDFQTITKLLHKTYQYEKVNTYFSEKWPSINALLPVLGEPEKLDILISVCITFFVLHQWEKAETIIQEVKENNQKIKRIDTLYFTFVFHCLILYEQKEWARLDSLINSEYHFLYSNKALRPFEKDMLLFIKKLPATLFKGKAIESMEAFLKKLDIYRNDDIQKLHFATFDFYSWVESKIEGIPYSSYMKKKALIPV